MSAKNLCQKGYRKGVPDLLSLKETNLNKGILDYLLNKFEPSQKQNYIRRSLGGRAGVILVGRHQTFNSTRNFNLIRFIFF